MFVTAINDCRDQNAVGRQATRLASLFGTNATIVGVENDAEAAGNLVDVLDAGMGREGVVLVNVAPRDGAAKRWENGTPFCHFTYEKTHVLASIDGKTLSLVKKLGVLPEAIHVIDTVAAAKILGDENIIDKDAAARIEQTQFRSFDFLPPAAFAYVSNLALPGSPMPSADIEETEKSVWWIDNFGNVKTTLLVADIALSDNVARTSLGPLPFYARLKDVPDNTAALIEGSSGIKNNRFLEIVVQGTSAATHFSLKVGSVLTL